MLVYAGVYICGAAVRPLLVIYFVVALYTARDLMIMSYKNKTVPVVIWSIFVPFIVFKKEIADHLIFNSSQDSIAFTVALLAGFLIYVPIYIKKLLKW